MRISNPNPNPAPKPAPQVARRHGGQAQNEGEDGNNNPVVSLDPQTPVDPQPLIADILRTGYCIPGSVFLVESVERSVPVEDLLLLPVLPPPAQENEGHGHGGGGESGRLYHHRDHDDQRRGMGKVRRKGRRAMRTVRLLLGDGELCVQAFCRGEIHRFVDSGSVFEGAYVRLDRFDVRGKGEMKKKGNVVVYLVVEDVVTVGWNEAYLGILRREKEMRERADGEDQRDNGVIRGKEQREDKRVQTSAQADDFEDEDGEEILQQLVEQAAATTPANTPKIHSDINPPPQASQKPPDGNADDLDYLSDSDSAFETLTISTERADQRRVPITAPDPRHQLQAAIIKQNQQQQQRQQVQRPSAPIITRPRPWLPTSATQPVKLTPLASVPHLPYRQNWMVNVLAIVASLAPAEPSHIAPSFRQRTARLADPSITTTTTAAVPKQYHGGGVLLTVYLDPDEFLPEVGSAVLLLGVKNHHFEGGSLRKYVSDGLVSGGSWWVQRVGELGWCRGEVERLRAWWEAEGRGAVGGG
ncbi:hypothetical protein N658DRAFT_534230 [Parathielavia hyrcaniae]|uniref:Uncharacterized protein n=1 Tax=Parathielavia hyrcaniae TaxID=113614 RepID=A0AAN6Q5B3_9PEZI|nr:hypothetical protein N658DRAFT_534230 [Parathielavia hyrcaniae]